MTSKLHCCLKTNPFAGNHSIVCREAALIFVRTETVDNKVAPLVHREPYPFVAKQHHALLLPTFQANGKNLTLQNLSQLFAMHYNALDAKATTNECGLNAVLWTANTNTEKVLCFSKPFSNA